MDKRKQFGNEGALRYDRPKRSTQDKTAEQRKRFGTEGEQLVAAELKKQGFVVEHKNYRKPYGEIDLIASKKDLLVFVEVKRRTRAPFALGQLITPSKQKKIILVAQEYIARYNHEEKYCRFDVALLVGKKITYIPDAFMEE